jgi:integrase
MSRQWSPRRRAGRGGRPSRALSFDQARAVLDAAMTSRLYAYVALSLMTGVRTQEARALCWDHVVAWVSENGGRSPRPASSTSGWLSMSGARHAHGGTKTDRSRRTLELPAEVARALQELHVRQAAERHAAGIAWQEHGLVFTTLVGTGWSAGNVRREFRKITKAAEIGETWTPRELRPSFVSMLSADGVAVEDIAHLVGHSSTRTTERAYRQELRPVLRTGAERMEKIFSP